MKPSIIETTIVLLLILLTFVNPHTLARAKSVRRWIWDSPKSFNNDIKVLENPTISSDYIQSFILGILSTVGITGASKVSTVLGLILDNKLTYSFTRDDKEYKCNKDGFFEYVKHFSIKSFNQEQQLRYNTCNEQKEKIKKKIKEIDDAALCAQDIKYNPYYNSCEGERYKNYEKYLNENGMDYKEIYNNYKILTDLTIFIREKYEKVDCEDTAVDGILATIVQKVKQGFFSIKFALSCVKDLEISIGMLVFTTIFNAIATFLSAGLWTIAKLVVIVMKMLYSVFLLIKNYEWQTLRYKHVGEIIGYFIRIGLEITNFPFLESPFIFSKSSKRLRKKMN